MEYMSKQYLQEKERRARFALNELKNLINGTKNHNWHNDMKHYYGILEDSVKGLRFEIIDKHTSDAQG